MQPASASASQRRHGLRARLDTPRKAVVGTLAFLATLLAVIAGVRALLPRDTDTDPSANIELVSVSPQTLAGFRQRLSLEPQDASASGRPDASQIVAVASAGALPLAQGTAPVEPPPVDAAAGDGEGSSGGGVVEGDDPGGDVPDDTGGDVTGASEDETGDPGGGTTTETGEGQTSGGTGTTTVPTTTEAAGTARSRQPDEVTDVLSPERPIALPEGTSPDRFRDDAARTLGLVPPEVAAELGDCPAACQDLLADALTGEDGEAVSPAVAAVRLTRLLGDTRTTDTPDGPSPAGMLVDVSVRLVDLEDRPVLVTWTLLDAGSEQRLFDRWLAAGVTYRLVPESDDDRADLPFWVPLPERRGPFFVRVYTYLGEQRSTHRDSDRFG